MKSRCFLLRGKQAALIAVLGVMLLAHTASAYANDFFYSSTVAVSSQTTRERARAARVGLQQVLVRVSGSVDIAESPEIRAVLAQASRHVEQFHYEQTRDRFGKTQEVLVMTFAPGVIEGILHDASMPFWPINRPDILVWLVEDQPDGGKTLVNDPNATAIKSLKETAHDRGLALKFPLLDLDDRLAISAQEAWNLDRQVVLEASKRYRADTVLLGRFTETSQGEWVAIWEYYHHGQSRSYDSRSNSADDMAEVAINPLADFLAQRYAVTPGGEDRPVLITQIQNVNDFAAYRKVLDYLKQLALITHYELDAVLGDTLVVSMRLSGTLDQLDHAMALDGKMRADPRGQANQEQAPWLVVPRGSEANPMVLHWIGR